MWVRFFGGWDFVEEDAMNRLPAEIQGIQKEYPWVECARQHRKEKRRPPFAVAALKDSYSGNLDDRIQIIKGWLDASGETHEKVYDVVWSGDHREPMVNCRRWATPLM